MSKRVIPTDRLMRPIAHFSHAVRVGDLVHVGATAGTDSSRRLAGGTAGVVDSAAQVAQMLDNVDTVLSLLGARAEDVVRVKTYVADPRDTAIYQQHFGDRYEQIQPSHAIVGSWGFPLPQAAVELDLVAVVGAKGNRFRSTALAPAQKGEAQAGVSVDDHYYCTALPIRSDGLPGGSDIVQQSEQMLANLDTMLSAAGIQRNDVCNVHVTLADMREFDSFEEVFRTYFQSPYPSRTVVSAPLQSGDYRVQIEVTAVVGGGQPIDGPGLGEDLGCASPGVLAGDTLYLSGQLGTDSNGSLPVGVEAQTRSAWMRLRRVLTEAGFEPDWVLRTNNVLTDWRHYAGFNAGYGANVSEPYAPRATVLGGLRDPNALVQIEAVAHRGGGEATIVQVLGAGVSAPV